MLAVVAVLMGTATAALVALLALSARGQRRYRRRLAAGPMHVHEVNGRKRACYGVSCRPVRDVVERAA